MAKAGSESKSPLATVDMVGVVAPDDSGEHVALALAAGAFVSGGALRNVKIVDVAVGDIIDKA